MGIHELESYVKNFLKDGVKDVNLQKEIEQFTRDNNGLNPIFVFDVMSFNTLLSSNIAEILCGGRHQNYAEILTQLFTRFRSLNVDLVFFLDGAIQDTKFSTWAARQNSKYQEHLKIMDHIYEELPLRDIVQKFGSGVYMNTLLSAIEATCAKFGQFHYTVNHECDFEIAKFAYENPRVLAVFSNDTDFMIFPGNFRYFSTKDLNLGTFRTKEFNRKSLHDHLNLTNFQRSIFATIAGNDILPHRDLRVFHENFGFSLKKKFPAIADYIRCNIRSEILPVTLNFLAREIYGNINDKILSKIHNSIISYNIERQEQLPVNPTTAFLDNHNIFTYNVLNFNPVNFSLVFVDLRQTDMMSYHDLAVPMFQRQAGVALAHSPESRVKIYTKPSHFGKYCKMILKPTEVPFKVPVLSEIFNEDPGLDTLRHDLLKWTIHWEKLKDFDLNLIPENYMIDILTIVYMKQKGILNDKEADIFLWTIKNVENGSVNKGLQPPAELDPRAFRLAFLYVRMFANVSRSIEVCGLKKKYGKPLNFDGVFFHHEYLRYKDHDFDTVNLLNEL